MQKIFTLAIMILLFSTGCTSAFNQTKSAAQSQRVAEPETLRKKKHLPRVCFQPNAIAIETRLKTLRIKAGAPLYIRIFKREKILELWAKKGKRYHMLKSYPICRYSGYLGPKLRSGDRQAPEGIYALTPASLNPNSHYHLALNINYPNRYDRNHHRDGDLIMIHGKCSSSGCFAMGNSQIEEIYHMVEAALKQGQKFIYVAIYPFRMSEKNLDAFRRSHWYPFWKNLQSGYLHFEQTHIPPYAGVKGARYIFQKRGQDLNLTQN
jgi:murein L,D-transpeptidase YafK